MLNIHLCVCTYACLSMHAIMVAMWNKELLYTLCIMYVLHVCLTLDGQEMMVTLTCVIVENHWLCKLEYYWLLKLNRLYILCCTCRRTKKDLKKTLFTICPKRRDKQCKNNHFAIVNNLLSPKVSRKGTCDSYLHLYVHIINEIYVIANIIHMYVCTNIIHMLLDLRKPGTIPQTNIFSIYICVCTVYIYIYIYS